MSLFAAEGQRELGFFIGLGLLPGFTDASRVFSGGALDLCPGCSVEISSSRLTPRRCSVTVVFPTDVFGAFSSFGLFSSGLPTVAFPGNLHL